MQLLPFVSCCAGSGTQGKSTLAVENTRNIKILPAVEPHGSIGSHITVSEKTVLCAAIEEKDFSPGFIYKSAAQGGESSGVVTRGTPAPKPEPSTRLPHDEKQQPANPRSAPAQ